MSDLDGATMLGRTALELHPLGNSDRASILIDLGICLIPRFIALDTNADLDEAIELHRSALDLHPAGHPYRAISLQSLAESLWYRFGKQNTMSDLQEAITHNRSALDLPHHDRCDLWNDLGVYLRRRFVHFDASADLDKAIAFCRSGLNFYIQNVIQSGFHLSRSWTITGTGQLRSHAVRCNFGHKTPYSIWTSLSVMSGSNLVCQLMSNWSRLEHTHPEILPLFVILFPPQC